MEYDDLSLLGQGKTDYPTNPGDAVIETFENRYPGRNYVITFDVPEFTSVCPKTNQPDFARIMIEYVPRERCLESKALKLYMFSFRNIGMFHENITNKILEDLVRACEPLWMKVTGFMNARGGISITVVAEHSHGQE